ncbi:hypothetical protein ALC62_03388 [Cyphomyrmex costatus]|uniref:Uncharacterized protein n=1 Tax=Cyphomyrmex costatus TaxID=456900 RepID=A0A195CYK0_9HYME|nr:hypothetical protein ALC62_03388 [Cyphomyrmex costatus]
MPLEGVSSSFFGITCWYRAVTPVTVLGSTKCFTRPAENITALREVTKLSATHPGVLGRTFILKVAKEHCHTCSTFANTLNKLRPASFLMSSSVHVGSSNKVANSCGYLETSSKPVGVLQKRQISNDGIIELIRLPYFFSTLFLKRNPIAFGVYVFIRRKELTRFLSTSSGTFLVELHSALAALCEKITGALVVCRAALIVLVETCERSTSMPSLFNSLTTACGGNIIKCFKIHFRFYKLMSFNRNNRSKEQESKRAKMFVELRIRFYTREFISNSFYRGDAGWTMLSIVGNACCWCLQGLIIGGGGGGGRKKRAILLPGLVDYRNFVVKCTLGTKASSNNTFVPSGVSILRHALRKQTLFVFEEAHPRSAGANAIENPIILHGQFSLLDVETPGDDSASSSRTVENSIFFINSVGVQTVTKFAKQISFIKQTEYLSRFSISRYLPGKLINLVNNRGGDYTLIFRHERIRLEIWKYSLEGGCWMKGGLLRGVTATLCRQRASRKVLGYLASLWEFSQFLQLSSILLPIFLSVKLNISCMSFSIYSYTPDEASRINELNRKSYRRYYPRERNDMRYRRSAKQRTLFSFLAVSPRPPFSAASPEFNEKANSTDFYNPMPILLHTTRSTYSETIMEVLSHLTCSYAIKSGPDFSRRRESLFGYTTGNSEVNAIVDSFLCLVNGTKKLVNVLTAAKDISFDPPVTSAYLRFCSLKSGSTGRFAKDASRTCRTRDLKSSLGDAFSLNESRNEAPRQTLVTRCPRSSFLKCAKFYVSL